MSKRAIPLVDLSRFINGTDMNANLLSMLPTSEPYTGLSFSQHGIGGNEKVANAAVFDQATAGHDIVDWVFLELRDDTEGSTNVLGTTSALLRRNGDIVGLKQGQLKIAGFAPGQSYNLVIRHRNHLGIMTNAAFASSRTTPSILNFAGGTTAAYGTDAMKDNGGGVFSLWPGDVNGDGLILYGFSPSDRQQILNSLSGNPNGFLSGYYLEDVNLDGLVLYGFSPSDRQELLNTLGGNPNGFKTSTIPN